MVLDSQDKICEHKLAREGAVGFLHHVVRKKATTRRERSTRRRPLSWKVPFQSVPTTAAAPFSYRPPFSPSPTRHPGSNKCKAFDGS